jgi:hypothetical protein
MNVIFSSARITALIGLESGKMGEATEIVIPRHGFNEADAKAYKEFFDKAFMAIGMAEQLAAEPLVTPRRVRRTW